MSFTDKFHPVTGDDINFKVQVSDSEQTALRLHNMIRHCGKCNASFVDGFKNYKFCPYCGKKL